MNPVVSLSTPAKRRSELISRAVADRLSGATNGWVVQTLTEGTERPDTILTKALVLSAGLSCVHLLNPLLPPAERLKAYYAKGEGEHLTLSSGLTVLWGQVRIFHIKAPV